MGRCCPSVVADGKLMLLDLGRHYIDKTTHVDTRDELGDRQRDNQAADERVQSESERLIRHCTGDHRPNSQHEADGKVPGISSSSVRSQAMAFADGGIGAGIRGFGSFAPHRGHVPCSQLLPQPARPS